MLTTIQFCDLPRFNAISAASFSFCFWSCFFQSALDVSFAAFLSFWILSASSGSCTSQQAPSTSSHLFVTTYLWRSFSLPIRLYHEPCRLWSIFSSQTESAFRLWYRSASVSRLEMYRKWSSEFDRASMLISRWNVQRCGRYYRNCCNGVWAPVRARYQSLILASQISSHRRTQCQTSPCTSSSLYRLGNLLHRVVSFPV